MGNNPVSNTDPLGLCDKQKCTQLQMAAAALSSQLEQLSNTADYLTIASGIGAGLAGAGEGITFGADTPVTITFGAATAFFASASVYTGASSAVMKSIASGNTKGMTTFDFTSALGAMGTAAASGIPKVAAFADAVGTLTGQAAAIAAQAEEVCK